MDLAKHDHATAGSVSNLIAQLLLSFVLLSLSTQTGHRNVLGMLKIKTMHSEIIHLGELEVVAKSSYLDMTIISLI